MNKAVEAFSGEFLADTLNEALALESAKQSDEMIRQLMAEIEDGLRALVAINRMFPEHDN